MPIKEIEVFRKKYPQYDDLDDNTIATKLATKYPDAYGDLVEKVKTNQLVQQNPPLADLRLYDPNQSKVIGKPQETSLSTFKPSAAEQELNQPEQPLTIYVPPDYQRKGAYTTQMPEVPVTAPKFSLSDNLPTRTEQTKLNPQQENEFVKSLYNSSWFKQLVNDNPEANPLDLLNEAVNSKEYDYRRAYLSGVKPEINPYDNKYHWSDKDSKGNWLKLKGHNTAWKQNFMELTGKDPDSLGLRNIQDAEQYIKQSAKDEIDYSKLPQPTSIGRSPEEIQRAQYAQNLAGLVNQFEGRVQAGYENIANGIMTGLKNVYEGGKGYFSSDPDEQKRGLGKIGLGALETGINLIPAVQGLNFVMPTVDEVTRASAKEIGVDEDTAANVVSKVMPFVFGRWVGTGSLAGDAVDYGIDQSGVLKGLSKEDENLSRELIRNAVFFAIAAPQIRGKLEPMVKDAGDKIAQQLYKPQVEVTPENIKINRFTPEGIQYFRDRLNDPATTPAEKATIAKLLKDENIDIPVENKPTGVAGWVPQQSALTRTENAKEFIDNILPAETNLAKGLTNEGNIFEPLKRENALNKKKETRQRLQEIPTQEEPAKVDREELFNLLKPINGSENAMKIAVGLTTDEARYMLTGGRQGTPFAQERINKILTSEINNAEETGRSIEETSPEEGLNRGQETGLYIRNPQENRMGAETGKEEIKPNFIDRAIRREIDAQKGQDILNQLENDKVKPQDVAETFWNNTYAKLLPDQKQKFNKMLLEDKGVKPGKADQENIQYGLDTSDYGYAIENLEGVERGDIALMAVANDLYKSQPNEVENARLQETQKVTEKVPSEKAEPVKSLSNQLSANVQKPTETVSNKQTNIQTSKETETPQQGINKEVTTDIKPDKSPVSSTQVNIPREETKTFVDYANKIPDKELYTAEEGYGKETEPHVTALYGLKTRNPKEVEDVIKNFGDVELELGKTSLFKNDKYDVLKVDVKSDDLKKLNKTLRDNLDYTSDFPDYTPHLTIAYLKPGEGQKYVGDNTFEGKKFKLSELMFSDPDYNKTPLKLSETDNNKATAYRLFSEGKKDTDVIKALGFPNNRKNMDIVRGYRREFQKENLAKPVQPGKKAVSPETNKPSDIENKNISPDISSMKFQKGEGQLPSKEQSPQPEGKNNITEINTLLRDKTDEELKSIGFSYKTINKLKGKTPVIPNLSKEELIKEGARLGIPKAVELAKNWDSYSNREIKYILKPDLDEIRNSLTTKFKNIKTTDVTFLDIRENLPDIAKMLHIDKNDLYKKLSKEVNKIEYNELWAENLAIKKGGKPKYYISSWSVDSMGNPDIIGRYYTKQQALKEFSNSDTRQEGHELSEHKIELWKTDDDLPIDSYTIGGVNDETAKILSKVAHHYGGKYSTVELPNGKILELRIAEHSANANNMEGDENLSIVIANKNVTERFQNSPSEHPNELYFDDKFTAEDIIEEIENEIDNIKSKYLKAKSGKENINTASASEIKPQSVKTEPQKKEDAFTTQETKQAPVKSQVKPEGKNVESKEDELLSHLTAKYDDKWKRWEIYVDGEYYTSAGGDTEQAALSNFLNTHKNNLQNYLKRLTSKRNEEKENAAKEKKEQEIKKKLSKKKPYEMTREEYGQFQDEETEYFARYSGHINEDLKRGWSSWNFGTEGFKGTKKQLEEAKKKAINTNTPLSISGFDLHGDEIKSADIRELYPDYWVLVDTAHESGLAGHRLESMTLNEALKEVKDKGHGGTGEGEFFNADDAEVIYSETNQPGEFGLHILRIGGKNTTSKHKSFVEQAIKEGKIKSHPDYPGLSSESPRTPKKGVQIPKGSNALKVVYESGKKASILLDKKFSMSDITLKSDPIKSLTYGHVNTKSKNVWDTFQEVKNDTLPTERKRELGEEITDAERMDGNAIDFGVGLGQTFTKIADTIKDYNFRRKAEIELGLRAPSNIKPETLKETLLAPIDWTGEKLSGGKIERAYREFLTAPAWFVDKKPELQRVWDAIDKYHVRNMNYDLSVIREDIWQNGKPWRKLENKKNLLKGLEQLEKKNYELQKNGDKVELPTFDEFIKENNLSEAESKFVKEVYEPTINKALEFVKDLDRYKIINLNLKNNPYLQDYNDLKEIIKKTGVPTNEKQLKQYNKLKAEAEENLKNYLESAKEKFFELSPNAESEFENAFLRGAKTEEEALNMAWGQNEDLRMLAADELTDLKYRDIDGRFYFPSSRLDKKYFLSGFKKAPDDPVSVLMGEKPDSYFTTSDDAVKLLKIKKDLESQGYETKTGKFKEAQEDILKNAVTQEDILDLAILAGVETDNKILDKLLKSIITKGFQRHFVHKKYIPGFEYNDANVETALSKYINAVTYYKNRNMGNFELNKTTTDLKEKGALKPGSSEDKYIEDLKRRLDTRDIETSKALRSATSLWYLALKPSYLIQQVVQPFSTLLPYLPIVEKELGLKKGEAEKAFGESLISTYQYWTWKIYDKINRLAGKESKETFGLEPEFLDVIKKLERMGVGKPLRSMELFGSEVDPTKYYEPSQISKVGMLPKIVGLPGIFVEDFTRTQGIRAYYNLAKKAGLEGEKLLDYISLQIARSYGAASGRLSKPPGYTVPGGNTISKAGQTAVDSFITFKNFAFMNYGQWGKIWRSFRNDNLIRPLIYKIGAQVGLGGLKYMMYASLALALINMIYGFLDIAKDARKQHKEAFLSLNSIVPGLGDALYSGFASQAFDVDLSGLFAQSAPIEEPFNDDPMEIIGGAPYSVGKDIVKGKSPSAIENLKKAKEYQEEGIKAGSRTLIPNEEKYKKMRRKGLSPEKPITNEEKTAKQLGFTPMRVSEAYEKENFRDFRSEQFTDIIRSEVEDKIVPFIENKQKLKAMNEFRKLFKQVQESGTMTELQQKKIKTVKQFIKQYVISRLEENDRPLIQKLVGSK
jgi:2'-5' RNA ligase